MNSMLFSLQSLVHLQATGLLSFSHSQHVEFCSSGILSAFFLFEIFVRYQVIVLKHHYQYSVFSREVRAMANTPRWVFVTNFNLILFRSRTVKLAPHSFLQSVLLSHLLNFMVNHFMCNESQVCWLGSNQLAFWLSSSEFRTVVGYIWAFYPLTSNYLKYISTRRNKMLLLRKSTFFPLHRSLLAIEEQRWVARFTAPHAQSASYYFAERFPLFHWLRFSITHFFYSASCWTM